jgi:hypothetical protein
MYAVVTGPLVNSASDSTFCRYGMFVLTPRMRNSCSARSCLATACGKVLADAVIFTSIES